MYKSYLKKRIYTIIMEKDEVHEGKIRIIKRLLIFKNYYNNRSQGTEKLYISMNDLNIRLKEMRSLINSFISRVCHTYFYYGIFLLFSSWHLLKYYETGTVYWYITCNSVKYKTYRPVQQKTLKTEILRTIKKQRVSSRHRQINGENGYSTTNLG